MSITYLGPSTTRRAARERERSPAVAMGTSHQVQLPRAHKHRMPILIPLLSALTVAGPLAGPADCGESARAFLQALSGSWATESSVRVAPGEYASSTGNADSRDALAGCGLLTAHEFDVDGSPRSEVHVLSAVADGTFHLSSVDSEHGAFTVSEGTLDGNVLTVEWSRDLGDRVLRTRKEFRLMSAGEYQVEHSMSRSQADPWETTYRGTFRRR